MDRVVPFVILPVHRSVGVLGADGFTVHTEIAFIDSIAVLPCPAQLCVAVTGDDAFPFKPIVNDGFHIPGIIKRLFKVRITGSKQHAFILCAIIAGFCHLLGRFIGPLDLCVPLPVQNRLPVRVKISFEYGIAKTVVFAFSDNVRIVRCNRLKVLIEPRVRSHQLVLIGPVHLGISPLAHDQ